MMRAAVYLRISNDPTGEAEGVARQHDLCTALVDKRGWDLVGVFSDNDRSAYKGATRPGWIDLTDTIRAGGVDVVVAYATDRLTRHPRELEDLVDLLEATGTQVETVSSGSYDLSSPEGRAQARIFGAMARQESERKAVRLQDANRHAALKGKRMGGRRAFGYENNGHDFRTGEAEAYREAVRRFLRGETIHGIVRDFQNRGITTTTGRPVTTAILRGYLHNPRYAGLRAYKGEIVAEADWPPLVDRGDWERLQAILNDPARKPRQGPRTQNLLTGFLRCTKCGRTLTTRKNHGNRSYGCPPTALGGCGGTTIKAEPLEEQVRDWIFEVATSPVIDEHLAAEPEERGSVARIAELEERADVLATMFAEGSISRRQFEKASQRINDDLEAERSLLRPTSRTIASLSAGEAVSDLWENGDVETKRELLAAVLDHIVVGEAVRGWNFHDPNRATFVVRN